MDTLNDLEALFETRSEHVYRDGRDDVGREVWHWRQVGGRGWYGPYPTEEECRFAARREMLRLLHLQASRL